MTTLKLNLRFTTLVCAYIVCTAIALWALPGADFASTLALLLCPTLITTVVYRQLRSYTAVGEIALFAAATLMSVGLIANVHYFTTLSGGTCADPVLQNYDAQTLWANSNALYGGGDGYISRKGLFGEYNAWLMHAFGHTIVVPLAMNMYMILSSLVTVSLIAYNLTENKRIAGYATCATAAVCYLLTMGTVLLRDAWVIFAMALAGYGLSGKGRYSWIAVALGALIMATIRTNWVWSIAVGVIVMHLAAGEQRRTLQTVLMLAFIFVMWLIPTQLDVTSDIDGPFRADVLDEYYHFDHKQQQAFYGIVGNYFSFPLYKKIILLPITIIVQFLIPFPWNFMRDAIYGITQIYAHISYPWYAFAGLVLYFMCLGRRAASHKLLFFTAWAAFCWVVPCLLFGGMVSRYGLPAIALLAPCVGVVLTQHLRLKSFKCFALCYVLIMAVALPTCYIIQTHFAS